MTDEELDQLEALAAAASLDPSFSRVPEQNAKNAAFYVDAVMFMPMLIMDLREAREALEESEHQMHLRIRAGYDKTVADSWRAWAEKQSKEAFSRGVAAMREAAIEACRPEYPDAVRRLRALPDPEDKP